jgi:hypothetical protein
MYYSRSPIPFVPQARYQMNQNYVAVVKQDLDKLLNASFIALMEETRWLLPIVIVSKKMASSGSMWIFYDSILQPIKIHIPYLLLKRFYMK